MGCVHSGNVGTKHRENSTLERIEVKTWSQAAHCDTCYCQVVKTIAWYGGFSQPMYRLGLWGNWQTRQI